MLEIFVLGNLLAYRAAMVTAPFTNDSHLAYY